MNQFGQQRGLDSSVERDSLSAILAIASEDDMNRRVCVATEGIYDPLFIDSGSHVWRIGF